MALDLSAIARRLIQREGRVVTLVQLGAANPATPWEPSVDPRVAPVSTLQLSAAFVQPGTLQAFGSPLNREELMARAQRYALFEPGSDLTIYQELIDADGVRMKIVFIDRLRPGAIDQLWYGAFALLEPSVRDRWYEG